MDAANLLGVPRPSDFIDASTRTLTAKQYTAALRGHQSALVVSDLPLLGRLGLDSALTAYCNHGHGVVLGGQTHWLAGAHEGWQVPSADRRADDEVRVEVGDVHLRRRLPRPGLDRAPTSSRPAL